MHLAKRRSVPRPLTSPWRGKTMFAITAGRIHRTSFSELFDFARAVPAQAHCDFGNGDDTAAPHSGARSERVRWMLFSRPSFREAVVLRRSGHRENVS